MNPIYDDLFSFDYVKYVYQEPNVRVINHGPPPTKPFELKSPDKSKKSKKDMKKESSDGKKPSDDSEIITT